MLFGYPAFVTLILQLHVHVVHPCRTCRLLLMFEPKRANCQVFGARRQKTKIKLGQVFSSVVTLIGTLAESSAA